MADARPAAAGRSALGSWRRLSVEQRIAAVGALLLAVSTIGPFSFVEGAELLVAFGVLLMLRQRAEGKRFHVPFGDGGVIAAAGVWAALLISVRLFDRPLGQNLLALACAAVLVAAGAREGVKHGPEDPAEEEPIEWEDATERLPRRAPQPGDDAETEPLPPPEYKPPSA